VLLTVDGQRHKSLNIVRFKYRTIV